MSAQLIDDYHEMACALHHNGTDITHVAGEIRRAPFSTCGAAPAALEELVGFALASGQGEIYRDRRARHNCTHLFDIAALAIDAASRGIRSRRFDFTVPDAAEGGVWVAAFADGVALQRWKLVENIIVEPLEIAGRSLFGGFVAWAAARFEGPALDAAVHLQKSIFVAKGRRFLIDGDRIGPMQDERERIGACYTFSEPQFSSAREIQGFVRDFSDGCRNKAGHGESAQHMTQLAISSIEDVIEDARSGNPYILVDADDRENEGDVIVPAQFATPSLINFMAKHARGLICLAITRDRAAELKLSPMTTNNRSGHGTAFTVSIEARSGVTTGISAHDRAHTIAVAVDPSKAAEDLVSPGHVFPLIARDGGVLVRAGTRKPQSIYLALRV